MTKHSGLLCSKLLRKVLQGSSVYFFPIFDESGVIVAITLKGSSGVIVVKEFVVLKPN